MTTQCYKGGYSHDFPIEDEIGCYCEEHGTELIRRRVDISEPPHPLLTLPTEPQLEQPCST